MTLIILRPDVVAEKLHLSPDLRTIVPLAGLILYGIVFLLQKPRARAAIAKTIEPSG